MTCAKCGTKNPDDFMFCLHCGERLGANPEPRAPAEAEEGEASPPTVAMFAEELAGVVAEAPVARLRVEQGAVDKMVFDLVTDRVVLGRRLDNDIVIHDSNVSRHHAELVREGDTYLVQDSGSANGTVVNDAPLERPMRLAPGDVIRVGEAVFVYEVGGGQFDQPSRPEAGNAGMTVFNPPPSVSLPAGLSSSEQSPLPFGRPPGLSVSPGPDPLQTSLGESLLEEPPAPGRSAGRPAPPAAASAGIEPAGSSKTSSPSLESAGDQVQQLKADLAALVTNLSAFTDRVEAFEAQIVQARVELGAMQDAARDAGAVPLRELRSILLSADAAGGTDRLNEIVGIIDDLADKPRDIDLLLQLSQHAADLRELLRVYAQLMSKAPDIRQALERLAG